MSVRGDGQEARRTVGPGDRPMWEQILTDLRMLLGRGAFDDRFPTDRELVERYGVSRHTVREAVRRLQDEGLVVRRRGAGSHRSHPEFEQPLGTLYSLFGSIEASGVPQTSVVIAQERRVDEEAAKVLDMEADADLFYLERIRMAGDEPLAHDQVWLPLPLAAPLLEADFAHTALYDELWARCRTSPEEGSERIRPVRPDRRRAVILRLGADEAAFEIDRRTRTEGRPLEWRVTVIRGDRYSFRVDWGGTEEGLRQPRSPEEPGEAGNP